MRKLLSFVSVAIYLLCIYMPAFAKEESGSAYYDFGVFAYEDGDYDDAEKNLKKALELCPNNPFYNHYLGKTYLKTGRYQEALHCLNSALGLNPDISGLKYDLAFLYFKMSDYTKSADLFIEIINEDPSNVLAHYYAGISLYKKKHYTGAINYLISAARMSPSIKANGYYYAGICYQKTGNAEKAVEALEYVKDHAESKALRENALKWLQAIENQRKPITPYSLYLKIGTQYDDNVRLEPLDDDIYAEDDDMVTVLYFSGKYNFVNKNDVKLGAGYNHYQTWHNDLTTYDLIGSILNFYIKYRLDDRFRFGFSYLPSYYWVDSDSFLMRHQYKPEVIWKIDDNLSARLSYSYYRNKNFRNHEKNGHTNDVFLDLYYNILGKRGYLFGGIGYEDNTASHPDQYYEQIKSKLGIFLNLPFELNLKLAGKLYDKDYNNTDSFYLVKRKDTKYNGSISISRNLFYNWLSVSAEYNHTKNDSNINACKYKRNITTLSLMARY